MLRVHCTENNVLSYRATLFRYQFNKDKMHIEVPLLLLLNGMNLDLGIPDEISIPEIDLPDIGLYIPSNTYSIPSFSILDVEDISWPLLGLAELSTEITSSLCSWEASVIGGNNTIDVPSLIGQYKIMSDCLLPFQLEGMFIIFKSHNSIQVITLKGLVIVLVLNFQKRLSLHFLFIMTITLFIH